VGSTIVPRKCLFDLDLEHCPNCGGELKIIAAIPEQPVIEKVLTHLDLQARAPPRSMQACLSTGANPSIALSFVTFL